MINELGDEKAWWILPLLLRLTWAFLNRWWNWSMSELMIISVAAGWRGGACPTAPRCASADLWRPGGSADFEFRSGPNSAAGRHASTSGPSGAGCWNHAISVHPAGPSELATSQLKLSRVSCASCVVTPAISTEMSWYQFCLRDIHSMAKVHTYTSTTYIQSNSSCNYLQIVGSRTSGEWVGQEIWIAKCLK